MIETWNAGLRCVSFIAMFLWTVYPDYSSYSPPRLSSIFGVGTRVIRGKDWSWGNDDGGIGGVGTVTTALTNGYLQVIWDTGKTGTYRMGAKAKYDLYLAPSMSLVSALTWFGYMFLSAILLV